MKRHHRNYLYLPIVAMLLISLFTQALGWKGADSEDETWRAPGNVRVNTDILRGIDLIYERDFDEAETLFRQLVARSPDSSAGYFYLAMVAWGRLTAGFWSPGFVREFEKWIDLAIEVARARIEEEDADLYDYFYLGGALGFKGRFELMKDNWLTSFFLARDAVDALKTCLRMDPENRDVLFGIGTFDYYTARFSGIKRFLAFLLLHKGDKKEGIRKLTLASREAVYSATEAKSMLLHIYLFFDVDPSKALEVATGLAERYRRNSRFLLLKGVAHVRLGMEQGYRDTVVELRRRSARASDKARASIWNRQALYLESIHDLFHQQCHDARKRLKEILKHPDPDTDPAMIAWPLMKIGMSYDLENNRAEAVKYYEKVLGMKNGAGAQVLAKKFMETPPKPGNPFLGY